MHTTLEQSAEIFVRSDGQQALDSKLPTDTCPIVVVSQQSRQESWVVLDFTRPYEEQLNAVRPNFHNTVRKALDILNLLESIDEKTSDAASTLIASNEFRIAVNVPGEEFMSDTIIRGLRQASSLRR